MIATHLLRPLLRDSDFFITMNDSYGDGWSGNTLVISSQAPANEVLLTAGLPTGSTGQATVTLPDGIYEVTAGGGSWKSEVSWVISDDDGNELLTGGAPYSEHINIESDSISIFTPPPPYLRQQRTYPDYHHERFLGRWLG